MAARFGWYTDFYFASRSSQLGAEKEKGYISNILRFQRRCVGSSEDEVHKAILIFPVT
jgi:hypothetical protein